MKKVENIIKETNKDNQDSVDWTKAWSKNYPILRKYQDEVDTNKYANKINKLLNDIKKDNGYNDEDSMLVLKDIMYHEYLNNKNKVKK